MANFKQGDMWSAFEKADRFIILCSSELTASNAATFKTPMATALVRKYPDANIPEAVGKFIMEGCGDHGCFGLRAGGKIGVFQDRRFAEGEVTLDCLGMGTKLLMDQANENKALQFHVEMPGQGLPYWLIKELVERCPDNVTFWSVKQGS